MIGIKLPADLWGNIVAVIALTMAFAGIGSGILLALNRDLASLAGLIGGLATLMMLYLGRRAKATQQHRN
jgi:hypothetical protein